MMKNSTDGPDTYKRKLRNILLKPGFQSQLAVYSISTSVLFALGMILLIFINFRDLFESILLLTDARDEVSEILLIYWNSLQVYIFCTVGLYLIAIFSITIWYTHRLVGPAVAFKRHILQLIDKNFTTKTVLRKNDAFGEVADALNLLSDTLGRDFGPSPSNEGKEHHKA